MNYENDELYIKNKKEYQMLKDQLFNERETYNFIDKLGYDNWNKKQVIREYIKHLRQERDKYKSIIDKLKKYLKEESKKDDTYFIPYLASIHKTLDKIKELEEGEDNESYR